MKQKSQWLSHVRTWSNSAELDLGPERLALALGHLDRDVEAAPAELDLEIGLVGQQPPLDHVAGHLAVQGHDLVARADARSLGRRAGRDSDDQRGRHEGSRLPGGRPGSRSRRR